ncbi:MAG TPA: hypothetical protein VGL42_13135 [Opitutaceae bacterium]
MVASTALQGWVTGDLEGVGVSSRTSSDYHRARLSNGRVAPETYVVGRGGYDEGAAKDRSIDAVRFGFLLKNLAEPLGEQGYFPAKDQKSANLLFMVYWGATNPSPIWEAGRDGNVENGLRSSLRWHVNARTASLLGYDSWWDSTERFVGTPFDFWREDLYQELEDARYFVVVMAYDFPMLRARKQAKLVWETRYSLRTRGHYFNESLAMMTREAMPYFGRDSRGLLHKDIPLGRVEVGQPRVVPDQSN